MKYKIEEMKDIISIVKIISVSLTDEEEDSASEPVLEPGIYCFDSLGQCWKMKGDVTELLALADMKDPVRRQERNEARERWRGKKKKRREDA
jgi:hypothetical protein